MIAHETIIESAEPKKMKDGAILTNVDFIPGQGGWSGFWTLEHNWKKEKFAHLMKSSWTEKEREKI